MGDLEDPKVERVRARLEKSLAPYLEGIGYTTTGRFVCYIDPKADVGGEPREIEGIPIEYRKGKLKFL